MGEYYHCVIATGRESRRELVVRCAKRSEFVESDWHELPEHLRHDPLRDRCWERDELRLLRGALRQIIDDHGPGPGRGAASDLQSQAIDLLDMTNRRFERLPW